MLTLTMLGTASGFPVAQRNQSARSVTAGMSLFPEESIFPLSVQEFSTQNRDGKQSEVTALRNNHLRNKEPIAARHGFTAENNSFRIRHRDAVVIFSSDIVGMDDILDQSEVPRIILIDTAHVPLEQIHSYAMTHPDTTLDCTYIPPESGVGRSDTPAIAHTVAGNVWSSDGVRFHVHQDRIDGALS